MAAWGYGVIPQQTSGVRRKAVVLSADKFEDLELVALPIDRGGVGCRHRRTANGEDHRGERTRPSPKPAATWASSPRAADSIAWAGVYPARSRR